MQYDTLSHGMADDAATVSDARSHEVMAAIDSGVDGPRLVIADLEADGAWLAMPAVAAARLDEWR